MDKNFIVFHLESLNDVIFQNNSDLFPNLKRFSEQCSIYKNYYSTSTSTFMVMSDLAYGDETVFEKSRDYATLIKKENRPENLFEELSVEGYYSEIIAPPFLTESEKQRYKDIFGEINAYFFADSYEAFKEEIDEAVKREKFALYITEFISHIGYSKYRGEAYGWSDNWRKGYKLLDDLLGYLQQLLKRESVMDKTVIVAYGDHGDDFYSHKFNGGFLHAIEPYSYMIKTPLFVYSGEGYKEKAELVSTTSLRSLIKNLIKETPMDVGTTYVYARNLYTAQKKEKNGLNKAFSVCNGEYLLMVSYRGLELYNIVIDPVNGFNLLDLFRLKKGALNQIRNVNLIGSSHFGYIVGHDFYKEIQEVFEELSKILKEYVLTMYSVIDDRNRAKEMEFCRINYISEIRYYKISENYIRLICKKLGIKKAL